MTDKVEHCDVSGNTIFCDDIRFEADGKVTYVGSYGNQMQVHTAFPATLPKFGFGIAAWLHRSLVKPGLVFKIFLPGDPDDTPSISAPVDLGGQSELKPGMHFAVLTLNLVASPFVIKKAGDIKVRLFVGDKHYALGRLGVAQGEVVPGSAAVAIPPTNL